MAEPFSSDRFRIHEHVVHIADADVSVEWALLEALPTAALVVDGSMAIAFANSVAFQLLQEHGELKISEGVLSVRRIDDRLLLDAAINSVLSFGAPQFVTFRSREKHPVMTVALRLLSAQRMLVVPVALRSGPTVSEHALSELLQLTPAQARLARRLASGDSLTEAAEHTGIALSTARWTLRALLAKSGARNQVMLMDLFSRAAHLSCLIIMLSF